MKYYTADLHIGHHNIIPMTLRPFQCVSEMEQVLIENWNRKVNDKDDVYIIGDLFFQHNDIPSILTQLKGRKHLIVGNHESRWFKEEYRCYFKSVQTSLEITDQNHTIYMCHYPMVSYPKQSRAYMIHGHIHNDTLFDYWPVLLKRQRILNAGVDINSFEPVTLQELILNNEAYKTELKASYPVWWLSVRFHLNQLKELNITKEEAYDKMTAYLNQHHLFPAKEGLYEISDPDAQITRIDEIRTIILNDPVADKLIKNFDVVHIDPQGNYSYLSYLYKESIYLK